MDFVGNWGKKIKAAITNKMQMYSSCSLPEVFRIFSPENETSRLLQHHVSVMVVGLISDHAILFIIYFTKWLQFVTTESKYGDLPSRIYLGRKCHSVETVRSGSSGASDKEWQIEVLFKP